ncbi:3-hydroxybutyryl-CoA dehydratase [Rubrobacter xylanophilus]|uniref:enoyl-CoA hydratase n=1 Tax=Rubrobacter xylanophilus TaxID=49319 RepID=A0A510HIF8_9ACTN|nr:enoyl-CoA hydratase-related protein [Rubrobacter xylanophilus]BBL79769.1 3-hydroxybutyryl-CoA dehydratase [Rubrobacter xylanophilus]
MKVPGYETLLVEVGEDRVGTITLNRPEKRNALSSRVVSELREALRELGEDERVGVLVFTGAGERAFAAGADITELREKTMLDALSPAMQALCEEIEGSDKPTIAAVNGYALGGGCELAMACDIRIAAENARFGLPEVSLGILPGAGGTQRLSRLIGKGRALELVMTGRLMDAREALSAGLVSRVVPQEELLSAAGELAAQILSRGPLAVRLARLAVRAGYEADQGTGLLIERLAQAVLFASEDKREGTAAFVEKRPPEFRGR